MSYVSRVWSATWTVQSWVDPRAWLSFIELDKAVVLVWLDWLVFCKYGFSVSALWCPLATPTILLGFLLPWAWGISSQLLQQGATTATPYLGWGVSPHRYPSWPQRGIAPLYLYQFNPHSLSKWVIIFYVLTTKIRTMNSLYYRIKKQ